MSAVEDREMDCALDLMRRLPPRDIDKNLGTLLQLTPHLTEDLLATVDQPLRIRNCQKTGREYLLCDYNRDGDSYRSPWSNEYDPGLEDGGTLPPAELRKLEVAANDAFDTYREMYFEGGASSVYMWDVEHGFAAVVLFKKGIPRRWRRSASASRDDDGIVADGSSKKQLEGSWDSIHVLEVAESSDGRQANYKLTSTIMLYMLTDHPQTSGKVNLSGSMTRQMEQDCVLDPPSDKTSAHIANMGRLIEEMEFKVRTTLQDIYFGKTKDIVNDLRSVQSLKEKSKQSDVQKELASKLSLAGSLGGSLAGSAARLAKKTVE